MTRYILLLFVLLFCRGLPAGAQTSLINIYGRDRTLLNGRWEAIVDPFDIGMDSWRAIYKDSKPAGKNDFVEYSFDSSFLLHVPGDFNSQAPELTYFESSVWYKKMFDYVPRGDERLFIHFGAVNYTADVFLNGKKLGRHEGGFTPFQFEITGLVREKDNSLIVRVNSSRVKNGIPGARFDWFNYGGITRDVHLIRTHSLYIEDYSIQLDPADPERIIGYARLNTALAGQPVFLEIPALQISERLTTDARGYAAIALKRKIRLWTPENPRLYPVVLRVGDDSVTDRIGFRTIRVEGDQLLLNGKPLFLRGVNIQEENPLRKARAFSEADAQFLTDQAKELGCNFIRLVHYPHNEYTVRLAGEKGLLVWEEIPVYQGINFADSTVRRTAEHMLEEAIGRDKNRCNIIFWSVANETSPSKERDETLIGLVREAKSLDPTRLVTAAFNNVSWHGDKVALTDSVMSYMDVIGVNEYLGWYGKWPGEPGKVQWVSDLNKPLIISEFGGEAVIRPAGTDTAVRAGSWSEAYMEQIYRDQLTMFAGIPFLRGVCPWVLADFRSPYRMQSIYQQGWNRKGLLSDQGEKKKAWYIMRDWYEQLRKK